MKETKFLLIFTISLILLSSTNSDDVESKDSEHIQYSTETSHDEKSKNIHNFTKSN